MITVAVDTDGKREIVGLHIGPSEAEPFWTSFLRDLVRRGHTYMAFPSQHRTTLHSTNPLERLNKEVTRRADVVGIFPNEDGIVRLIGAVLLQANDEWQLQHRYLQIEGMAELNTSTIEEEKPLQITTKAA
jgi:transposase-like protein